MAEPTKQRVPSITDTITGAIDAFDDLADTIANPPQDKPLRAAIGEAGQKYCNYLGAVPGAASGLLGPGFIVGGLLCKPYWDGAGYDAPVQIPPFTGGQCAVLYSCPIFRNPPGPGAIGSSLANILGPVTDVSTTFLGSFQWRCSVTGANGTQNQVVNVLAGEPSPTLGPLVRQDGSPDNCGNPPGGTYAPGANPPPTPSFPSGSGPGVDPDGQPYFFVPPIDSPIPGGDPIGVPPLPTTDNPSPAPPGPGEPGTPVTPGDGVAAEGEADDGEELVGVKVEVLTTPENANKFQDISVNVWRGIGYVRMGYPGRLGVDMSAATAQSPQFYHAQQRGLTNWEVLARNGFTIRATPYFRKIEQ